MRAIRSLLFIISLAYVSDTITYKGAIIACHRRMCAYICETESIHSSQTVFHHRAYIRIYSCHIYVITMSYLKLGYILVGCYVLTKIDMKSQEKKLDISSMLYVAIMITVFILALWHPLQYSLLQHYSLLLLVTQ